MLKGLQLTMIAAFPSLCHANSMVCTSHVFDAMPTLETFSGSLGMACSGSLEPSRYVGSSALEMRL